jgi:hypothetical protein
MSRGPAKTTPRLQPWRCGDCRHSERQRANATRAMRLWRRVALTSILRAARALDKYALATDTPELGVVEAADLLNEACKALDGSP